MLAAPSLEDLDLACSSATPTQYRMLSADAARKPIHMANDHAPIDQRSVVAPREYTYYYYKLTMTTLGW